MHTLILRSSNTFAALLPPPPPRQWVPVNAVKKCIYTSHESCFMIYQEALEISLVIQSRHSKVWGFFFLMLWSWTFEALKMSLAWRTHVYTSKKILALTRDLAEFCNPCRSFHIIFRDVENNTALPVVFVLPPPTWEATRKRHISLHQNCMFRWGNNTSLWKNCA